MIQAKPSVLIVDDDVRLRELLQEYLTQKGFLTEVAEHANRARLWLRQKHFDVMILDVMMPSEDGVSFLKWIRLQPSSPFDTLPILMLTALGESNHRIDGLSTGADDYLVKPFEPQELVLRLHNLIRRYQPHTPQSHRYFGVFVYDMSQDLLYHNRDLVHLTSGESRLLHLLLEKPGIALSRDALAHAMGLRLSPRSVDVQITRLRKKIEDNPKQPFFLCTARHEGYVMKNASLTQPQGRDVSTL